MSPKKDPLLTGPEAAARIGITAGTWRGFVSRGVAPPADDPDNDRPPNRRSPRWLTSTVDTFKANRIGQGRRPVKTLPIGAVIGNDVVVATYLQNDAPTLLMGRPDGTRYERAPRRARKL